MGFTGYKRSNSATTTPFQFNVFVAGQTFRITDYCFINMIDGQDSEGNDILRTNKAGEIINLPGFGTTLGDDIRLTELYRGTIDANGNSLTKDTEFTKDLVALLIANRGKSTEEVLQAVVNKFKDTDLKVVSAKPYQGRDASGQVYTATFRVYDYAD